MFRWHADWTPRTVLRVLVWAPVAAVGGILLAAIIENVADKLGVIESVSGGVVSALAVAAEIARAPWFGWIGGLAFGVAISVWLDAVVRKREKATAVKDAKSAEATVSAPPPPQCGEVRLIHPKADLAAWADVDPLTLRQAACLWSDTDPSHMAGLALEGPPAGRLAALISRAEAGAIPVAPPTPNPAWPSRAPRPEDQRVTRDALSAYAASIGDQPSFLGDRKPAPPSPVPPPKAFDIKLGVTPGGDSNHEVTLDITALERVSSVAVVVRYAFIVHYMSGATWKWSKPRRLAEAEDLVSGEVLSVPFYSRDAGIQSVDTPVRVFGDAVVPRDPEQPDGRQILRLQAVVHHETGAETFEQVWQFRRISGQNFADVLDGSSFDYPDDKLTL